MERAIIDKYFKHPRSAFDKPIYAGGEMVNTNFMTNEADFNINYSSILTRLIQEAGRVCESYASDLFVSWTDLMEDFTDYRAESDSVLFGFRRGGIDHTEWVISNAEKDAKSNYYSIWRLDINIHDIDSCHKSVDMELYCVG